MTSENEVFSALTEDIEDNFRVHSALDALNLDFSEQSASKFEFFDVESYARRCTAEAEEQQGRLDVVDAERYSCDLQRMYGSIIPLPLAPPIVSATMNVPFVDIATRMETSPPFESSEQHSSRTLEKNFPVDLSFMVFAGVQLNGECLFRGMELAFRLQPSTRRCALTHTHPEVLLHNQSSDRLMVRPLTPLNNDLPYDLGQQTVTCFPDLHVAVCIGNSRTFRWSPLEINLLTRRCVPKKVNPTNVSNLPSNLHCHTAVPYVRSRHHVIIFGGACAEEVLNDVFDYDYTKNTWTKVLIRHPPTQTNFGMTYGGANYNRSTSSTTASSSFPSTPVQSPPSHSGLQWGGDTATSSGLSPQPTSDLLSPPAPRKRLYHAATAIDHKMYIFGGAPLAKTTTREDEVFADLWVFTIDQNYWREVKAFGVLPSKRGSCSFHYIAPYIYLYGGFDGQNSLNDLFVFDPLCELWRQMDSPRMDPNIPRWGCASCVLQNAEGPLLVVAGGFAAASDNGDGRARRLTSNLLVIKPRDIALKELAARWLSRSE